MNHREWLRKVIALAEAVGARVEVDRRHLAIRHPSGWFVITAKTPSDVRSYLNLRADIRRQVRAQQAKDAP